MARTPAAEQVQVNFRMPEDLRDRIKQAAERNGRSMNAEIVASLEDAYPAPVSPEPTLADLYRMMDEIYLEEDEAVQDDLASTANAALSAGGQALRILLSPERDTTGRRQIYLAAAAPDGATKGLPFERVEE
ncbi:Arc family DNA-binding protein [Cereibacter azotoformans]|uniref:Arc family DNA-binding protein n=1 Tax=Cereibacter azotoformans TaxID=43057 RepID=UPI000C6E9990|nr:Arc family DNA-binding protein [Cereibacter azotoformans]